MLEDFLNDFFSDDTTDLVSRLLLVVAILLLTWLLRQIVNAVIPALLRRFRRGDSQTLLERLAVDALRPPVRFLISVGGLWVAALALELPPRMMNIIDSVLTTLAAYGIFWAVYRLADPLVSAFTAVSRRAMRDTSIPTLLDERLTMFIQQIFKALIMIIGIAMVIEAWGYDISGLIAGLGLGGLAFALAAQNTLENLLGYFVILADEPLRVGEYVVFGDINGTVEKIGFRSTRLRSLDQSLITVPNKTIMNANVTNWSRLAKRRLNVTLGLSYTNSPKQILSAVQAIREMLKAHKLVQEDSVIVQFVDLGKDTLDIMIICFMNTPNWNDFQAAKQDINLRIMSLLAARGVAVTPAARILSIEPTMPPDVPPARLPPLVPEPAISTATDSPVPNDAAN